MVSVKPMVNAVPRALFTAEAPEAFSGTSTIVPGEPMVADVSNRSPTRRPTVGSRVVVPPDAVKRKASRRAIVSARAGGAVDGVRARSDR